HLGVLAQVPGAPGAYGAIGRHPDYERIPGLLVVRLEAPLFYANASLVVSSVKRLVGAGDRLPRAGIRHARATDDLDLTSCAQLELLADSLHAAGIELALADVRLSVIEMARRSGLMAKIGEAHVFHTIDEAVQSFARAG